VWDYPFRSQTGITVAARAFKQPLVPGAPASNAVYQVLEHCGVRSDKIGGRHARAGSVENPAVQCVSNRNIQFAVSIVSE